MHDVKIVESTRWRFKLSPETEWQAMLPTTSGCVDEDGEHTLCEDAHCGCESQPQWEYDGSTPSCSQHAPGPCHGLMVEAGMGWRHVRTWQASTTSGARLRSSGNPWGLLALIQGARRVKVHERGAA